MNHENYDKPLRPVAQLLLELKDIEFQLYKYCHEKEYKPSVQDFMRLIYMHDTSFQVRALILAIKGFWEIKDFVKEKDDDAHKKF